MVTLNGGGWVAGQKVEIFVDDDGVADAEMGPWSHAATVTASASGVIVNQFNLAPWFVANYSVVATGECSEARTAFTDKDRQAALTVTSPTSGVYNQAYTLEASGGSGTGALSFAATGTACQIATTGLNAGKLVITSGTGTCSVTATKAGDSNFTPITSDPLTVTIGKATATLTLGGLSQTYTGTARTVSVTTNPAGLSIVAITYDGSTTAPAAAGSYAVVATLTNVNYSGTQSGTLVIGAAGQTITFAAIADKTFGTASFTVSATASSGLPVSFAATGNCTVATSTVTITGAGSCTITASQAGNTNYSAAENVSRSFNIAKANQATLTVIGPPIGLYGMVFPALVLATGGSGTGAGTIAATGTACEVPTAGAYAGMLVITSGTGTCSVTATKATDANYNATTSAPFSVTISKAPQTIDFPVITDKTFGAADFDPGATASSGLAVSYAATGACSIIAGKIHIGGSGSCTVTASQPGNTNVSAATDVAQTFNIGQASQTITFGTLAGKTYGDPAFTVSATATSGLTVSFGVTGNCTLASTTVTITGSGSCTVTASQAGNNNYSAATNVARTFSIAQPQVVFTVKGPYQPIDLGGVTNTTKGGSTVPIKFEVFQGATEITDASVVTVQIRQITCGTISNGTEDIIEQTAAGNTSLRYDTASGQFIYNWKTPKEVGTCYAVTVVASQPGSAPVSSPTAYIKLK
jgi:hypothetical protein